MNCKIWGVKAHIKAGINTTNIAKGLKNMLNYVDDSDKIHGSNIENPFEKQQYDTDDLEREIQYINTSENFFRVVSYMADANKTKNTYISGYLCDPDHAIEQFMQTKMYNLKQVDKDLLDDLGNQGFHIVQSFPDDLEISDEEVHQCGVELCEKIKVHQAVITSHLHPVYDKNGILRGNCKHNHILINSHINPEFIDPDHPERMKYHDCKESYAQLRAWNDEIAIEHGLPIIVTNRQEKQYSWYENELNNEGKSWTKRMMYDIENAMNEARNWDEYKALLTSWGYKIREGQHETYTAPDNVHKARGTRLGHEYTKAYMQHYWELKQELNALLESEFKDDNRTKNINDNALSELQIATLLADKNHKYHTEIPRINKRDNSRYSLKIPLRFDVEQAVVKQYIKDELSYPLYNEDRNYLGNMQGVDLKEVLYHQNMEQYLKFKHWEEEETKRTQEEELKAILKKSQKEESFSIPGWNNSKTKQPYRIGLYDSETGRRRSLIEHILIFAMVVVNKEVPEFALTEAQKKMIQQTDKKLSLVIAPQSHKSKKLMEAIVIAKEENIQTLEELKAKLNETGKNLQKASSARQRNQTAIENMQKIYDAIMVYQDSATACEALFAMKNGKEKNQLLAENESLIRDYNYAKSLLYHHEILSEEKRNDFLERYQFHQTQDQKLLEEVEHYSSLYTRLKKLKYQIDLSLNKEYCYGKSKDLNKYKSNDTKPKEKELEPQKE